MVSQREIRNGTQSTKKLLTSSNIMVGNADCIFVLGLGVHDSERFAVKSSKKFVLRHVKTVMAFFSTLVTELKIKIHFKYYLLDILKFVL